MRNICYTTSLILIIILNFTAIQATQQNLSFSKKLIALPVMISLGIGNAYFIEKIIEPVPNIYLRLASLIAYVSVAVPGMQKISSFLDEDKEQQKNLTQIGFASSGLYYLIKGKKY
jgi:hypothetical protein